ncbi:hypothetical protein DKX38_007240 [Salix brachista]|uniref:Uncharacterized protein n=1 Tax=Salix brachista TaxID=2182728 RepID=A0A5N5MQ77_9ROSI|nr:hypothetical protein DKX38_007240 [Salix brachista]
MGGLYSSSSISLSSFMHFKLSFAWFSNLLIELLISRVCRERFFKWMAVRICSIQIMPVGCSAAQFSFSASINACCCCKGRLVPPPNVHYSIARSGLNWNTAENKVSSLCWYHIRMTLKIIHGSGFKKDSCH